MLKKCRYLFLIILSVNIALSAQSKEVSILYANDIESVYDPVEAFWNNDIELIGGIPYLATLIKQTQSNEELSFLFDAGDMYTGASSAFVAYGGDDYKMLAEGKLVYQTEKRKIDYIIDYSEKNKILKVPSVVRQIDISKKSGY